ncbi:glycosyltransferase [Paenibacillus sp. YYML68]|uniref:glycosyltransferase n=1 Tax=Paenibacillus sp. YYML68 TaxID=2909250 RepID=UPI00249130E3|nr:glycosyltransferase [Paenibacillus sp. YYML68]
MVPAVSVIVPVYNVEKYLSRCAESLMNQTLRNIEIIMVNDGSTDQSGQLADQYAEMDSRIKVVHKLNGGLSSARNAGLEAATGEYVGFVDSDDWVELNMYEHLYQAAIEHDAEASLSGGFLKITEDGQISKRLSPLGRASYDAEQLIDEVLIPMVGATADANNDISMQMGVTLNIYKRKLLQEYGVRFVSERQYISEDIVFNLDVFTKVKRASAVPVPMYYYWLNVQSLTQSFKPDRFEKECMLFEHLTHKLKELGLYDLAIQRLRRTYIGRARVCIVKEARDHVGASVFQRLKNIRRITGEPLLVDTLNQYPIAKLNIKLQLMTYGMKYRLSLILFLVSIFRKRV